MVVYKITNQANGKVYIGKTVQPLGLSMGCPQVYGKD